MCSSPIVNASTSIYWWVACCVFQISHVIFGKHFIWFKMLRLKACLREVSLDLVVTYIWYLPSSITCASKTVAFPCFSQRELLGVEVCPPQIGVYPLTNSYQCMELVYLIWEGAFETSTHWVSGKWAWFVAGGVLLLGWKFTHLKLEFTHSPIISCMEGVYIWEGSFETSSQWGFWVNPDISCFKLCQYLCSCCARDWWCVRLLMVGRGVGLCIAHVVHTDQ